MAVQLNGGFSVFIANYLNGLCSFCVQPAFRPPHIGIHIEARGIVKNLRHLSCRCPAETLQWVFLLPPKIHIPQRNSQGCVSSATADRAALSLDSFLHLLWIQTRGRTCNSLSSVGHFQPHGLPISCTFIQACLKVTLCRKPYSTPFPSWLKSNSMCTHISFYSLMVLIKLQWALH